VTPARIGQTYLRKVHDEMHDLEDVWGRALYHTSITISDDCIKDLKWWHRFLASNPNNTSRSGMAATLLGTWGDGSGTGADGTIKEQ
jgi:hypothetical protein